MSPQQSAGEKTERATPKKRRDARERGQVLKSTEVNTAFCCVIIFGFMLIFRGSMLRQLGQTVHFYLGDGLLQGANTLLTPQSAQLVFAHVLYLAAGVLLPILFVAMLCGLLVNILQVGFLFTTKPLMPKLERISPIKGFKRIFSIKTLIELLKCLIKITVLGLVLYNDFKVLLTQLPALTGAEIYTTFNG
ncbi:MAG: EscU/YscU/HrcU family type III secretion system export apparatus switch protein, partial [Clostridiales bacterium]|nr:EscU/YscU/HrcU family type III secretion system export apparatus switch protein [Clostridiales bacterium]